jgi:uncharacterized protein with HEPN domain
MTDKKVRNLFRLGHILDCIAKVEYLTNRLQHYDNFEKQWIEQDAIIRNLEIIGEASINVSDDMKEQYPNVDWKEMRGMRNFVTHEYFGISLTIIWDIVTHDIPVLKKQIQDIINDLSEG